MMKAFGSSFIMDYGATTMPLIFGMLCLSQVIDAQSDFRIPCPPAFPDFNAIFSRTLRLNDKLRTAKFQLQYQFNRPPNCSCSPGLMQTIGTFNRNRCGPQSSRVDKVCPTTSSSVPTVVTRPPTPQVKETSSLSPIPPSPTTIGYSTGGFGGEPTSTPDRSRKPAKSTLDGRNVITLTTKDSKPTGLPGGPTANPVTTRDQGFTIVVIAIGAGVLLLIFLIGCLLLCRKRLCVGSGVRDARLKHEKVRRLRSDCQPISAISRADTFEESYPPSMSDDPNFAIKISSVGSVGSVSEGYRRSYVTNGRKWRPEFDSETGSEKSSADAKYILLREDSSASALSFSNHYNTLRTIDSPHALMMGGFGESSTDMTIPRTSKKKRLTNGDISLDSIEDPMEVMPSSSTLRRKQSKDSLNSIEIYDRVSRPRGPGIPGYVNGHGPPPSARRERGEESDSCSLGTIDQEDDDHLAAEAGLKGQQPVVAPVRRGIINLSFQPEDPSEKVDPNWQDEVLDELKMVSSRPPSLRPTSRPPPPPSQPPPTDDDDRYDSLLSTKNAHLFGYDNKTIDSSDSHIDPPSDFRDSKDSEISVAVVQPLKQEKPYYLRDTKRDSIPEASCSSPPPKKSQPPPVAKKPQNGSVKNGLTRLSSSDSGAPEAVGRPGSRSSTGAPMVNGVTVNGHVNGHEPMVNGVDHQDGNDIGKVKKFIKELQQKEAGLKPSAHVQPQRYGDTRL